MKAINLKSTLQGRIFQTILLLSATFSWSCNQSNSLHGQNSPNQQDSLNGSVVVPKDCNIIVEEPVSYKGLEVFPISLKNEVEELNYLTLSEALTENKLIIEETSEVNQLTVTNNSASHVFIMAGDIIKGGKQDRTLGVDAIIPPNVKKMPIKSYCVESGRWQQRGSENQQQFSSNTKSLSSKDLKLASKYKKNQSDVWQGVAEQQEKLNKNISEIKEESIDVRSNQSGSSLQLTLESKDLNEIINEYKTNLSQLYNQDKNIAGFAYAINGELYGIDIFNDPGLFKRLSSKLYESVIVEAISEYNSKDTIKPVGKEAVYSLYQSKFEEKPNQENINKVTNLSTSDNKEAVLFNTKNSDEDLWIHKNYIPKNEDDTNEQSINQNSFQKNLRREDLNNIQIQE